MKSGICPKCGLDKVFKDSERPPLQRVHPRNGLLISSNGVFRLFGGKPPEIFIVDNYVCTNCGYVETYIAEKHREKFSIIRALWTKVPKKSD